MSKFKNRFTYIVTEATECCYTWTNKEQVQFHYFNPNGIYAQKKAMDERISAAVDAGRCKSGSIIAHGTLNYYSSNRLTDMVQQKRVLGRSLQVTINMMERDLESAEAFLASMPPAAAPAAIEAPEASQEAAAGTVTISLTPEQVHAQQDNNEEALAATNTVDYAAACEANAAALNVLDNARDELAAAKKWRAGFRHASRLGWMHLNWRVQRATAAFKAASVVYVATQEAVEIAYAVRVAAKAASEMAVDPFEPENCKCCDRPITDSGLWLNMSVGQKYTTLPGVIPEAQSQGWFAFHPACAFETLARAQYPPA